MSQIQISAFYDFFPIEREDIENARDLLRKRGLELELRGLFILAQEGCNSTISGTPSNVEEFKFFAQGLFPKARFSFKDSLAAKRPFKRFKVDIREDIVNIGNPISVESCDTPDHLSPEDWNALLHSDEDVLLLDVRNDYETKLGIFEGAQDPNISCFSEFPDYVRSLQVPKNKKVLMYCTGGIRCEKAALEMKNQGFEDVKQLQGGILGYLDKFPNSEFKGECFVFDERVSLAQDLSPSRVFRLCPHCGDPGNLRILCAHCEKPATICKDCAQEEPKQTCSKNCAYHHRCTLGINRPAKEAAIQEGFGLR